MKRLSKRLLITDSDWSKLLSLHVQWTHSRMRVLHDGLRSAEFRTMQWQSGSVRQLAVTAFYTSTSLGWQHRTYGLSDSFRIQSKESAWMIWLMFTSGRLEVLEMETGAQDEGKEDQMEQKGEQSTQAIAISP